MKSQPASLKLLKSIKDALVLECKDIEDKLVTEKMKVCRKYPVSLDDYRSKHEKKHGTEGVEGRYKKACLVYSAFKNTENKENREFARLFKDLVSEPMDAFDIWWDI